MAAKVKLSVKLNLDHDLGNDHFQTWLSQLKIAFALHGVEDQKAQYLAAATNLGESGVHYLWQSYPTMPDGDAPFDKLESLFTEYFGGKRSKTSRLAALFTIGQQDGESIQAYRHRLQEMRVCDLTTAADVDAVLDAMAVHLFARGLSSSYTRQKVLESGENVTLAKVAESAQAITLAAQAVGEQRAGIEEAVASVSFTERSSRPRGLVSQERGPAPSTCGYCGDIHVPGVPNCPATNAFCSKCGRRGHLGSVCRAGGRPEQRSYRFHSNRPAAAPSEIHSLEMQSPRYETFGVRAGKTGFTLPMRHIVLDGQHTIALRVDSASKVTVLPKSTLPPGYQLQPPPCPLQPVGSQQITAVGVFEANLRYQAQETRETVFVVDDTHGTVPSLLGEQASIRLGLLAAPIASVELPSSTEGLSSLPAMRGSITISVDPEHPPSQQSPRCVAPPLIESLRQQQDAWLEQGVVEMVDEVAATDFVSPLVAVPKADKTVRWCVDLRRVNAAVRRPGVQLPTADDLLAQLAGARVFSKLDLKSGYSQLEISPECSHAFLVASPLGYFCFCRLPFGVSSGPELFQRKMEQILAGCAGVVIYLDDILIFASSQEEHDRRQQAVLATLRDHCVTLNEKKCVFGVTELEFLGHHVTGDGISPGASKVDSLRNMPDPRDISELRSFLGLATYLAKFVPNMATVVAPLNALLSGPWNWTSRCHDAAEQIRNHFISDQILALFDPALPTCIEVDASGQGLGAVLLQLSGVDDPEWRPVYYTGRKLTTAESRYATIEREALAVVWGADRFRNFVTGMPIVVFTDHKPLVQVFSADYNLAAASLRVQRLVLKVQDLQLDVRYRPGKLNYVADALSRLPSEEPDPSFLLVQCVTMTDGVSAHRQLIARETARDTSLCSVRSSLELGKWSSLPDIAPIQGLSQELSVWPFPNSTDFLILRGERVVIPASLTQHVLSLAHEGHPGRDKTLQWLRETVWWPGWNKAARHAIAACVPCITESSARPVPLKPREMPPQPWHSVAVDIFYYQQIPFLSFLDLYSRYPAVVRLRSETATAVCQACDQVFTLFGAPRHMISDNGPQFISVNFQKFMETHSVIHERTVPYSPRQNPVERLHQTLKRMMRKSGLPSAEAALLVALQAARSTVNTVTGKAPGDLFLRGGYRPCRTHTRDGP